MSGPGDPQWSGRQGFAWTRTFRVKVAGVPVPLTGYGIEFRMRRYFDTTGDPLLEFTRDNDEFVVDDLAGEMVLTIDALKMRALPDTLGRAPFQAELDLLPDNDPAQAFALVAGPFPIDPEVMIVDGD